jgi:hypothetical protein
MAEALTSPDEPAVRDISIDDMPAAVRGFLEAEQAFELSPESANITVGQPQAIHFEGLETYVLPIDVHADDAGVGEEVLYLVDTDAEGQKTGIGLVAKGRGGLARYQKPYVGYTETDETHRREGLGLRRLRLMNRLALREYDQPLHSDPNADVSDEAKAVWLKLVNSGEAEFFHDEEYPRFRFRDSHR